MKGLEWSPGTLCGYKPGNEERLLILRGEPGGEPGGYGPGTKGTSSSSRWELWPVLLKGQRDVG